MPPPKSKAQAGVVIDFDTGCCLIMAFYPGLTLGHIHDMTPKQYSMCIDKVTVVNKMMGRHVGEQIGLAFGDSNTKGK